MDKQDLIFWDFFHQIEKELSYERWIDKYLLFLDTLLLSKTIRLQKGDEWSQFKSFCKFLYLQDIRDEAKFEQLLDTAIAREEKQLRAVLSETVINEDAETKTGDQSKKETPEDASVDDVEKPVIDEQAGKDLSGAGNFPEPGGSKNERSVYYNPPLQPGYQDNIAKKQKASFLLTDEYFP
ncbi:MAG TPA: hypothetical protein VK622_02500, partial [Puia sp.]|nr:hypothetical protein [Puia sp.]